MQEKVWNSIYKGNFYCKYPSYTVPKQHEPMKHNRPQKRSEDAKFMPENLILIQE